MTYSRFHEPLLLVGECGALRDAVLSEKPMQPEDYPELMMTANGSVLIGMLTNFLEGKFNVKAAQVQTLDGPHASILEIRPDPGEDMETLFQESMPPCVNFSYNNVFIRKDTSRTVTEGAVGFAKFTPKGNSCRAGY